MWLHRGGDDSLAGPREHRPRLVAPAAVRRVRRPARPSARGCRLRGLLAGGGRHQTSGLPHLRRPGALDRLGARRRAVQCRAGAVCAPMPSVPVFRASSGRGSGACRRRVRRHPAHYHPRPEVQPAAVNRAPPGRAHVLEWARRTGGRGRGCAGPASSSSATASGLQSGRASGPAAWASRNARAAAGRAYGAASHAVRGGAANERRWGVRIGRPLAANATRCPPPDAPVRQPIQEGAVGARRGSGARRRCHDDWRDPGCVRTRAERGGRERGPSAYGSPSRCRITSRMRAAISSRDCAPSTVNQSGPWLCRR